MREDHFDDTAIDNALSRRGIMKAAGAAGVLGFAGTAYAHSTGSEEPPAAEDDDDDDSADDGQEDGNDEETPSPTFDDLNIGGRLIVGDGGYDTIQGAWDEADDGDTVYVHSSYDAQAGGEAFPIVLDQSVKEVSLSGGHPSGSVIDAEHQPNQNVVEVYGVGSGNYRNTALVQNLKIVGGNVGLQVVGAPNSTYSHLKFFKCNSHGAHLTTKDGYPTGGFGTRWYDCEAWSCGGSGFRIEHEAAPHDTTFIRCNSTWNGYNGTQPGVVLRGFSSVWYGGTIQQNASYGITCSNGGSQVVRDSYIESNGVEASNPVNLRATGSIGLIVDSCYFNGMMLGGSSMMDPAGNDSVERAIELHNAHTSTVRGCSHRSHSEGFISIEGSYSTDNDIHEHTHHDIDGSTPFLIQDGGTRTRSNGMVRQQDLRAVDGKYEGDRGIHDGSGTTPFGPAMWNGSQWISVVSGSTL